MVSSTNILILGGGNDSKDMRKAWQ
jgi:hypothetical protein